ncbi:MAG: GDP-mannose 4,6-dehydratase [Gemmatimonadales bacterium]|nr:GDP-mannose 4,6-dehydratase [Gemmatimonadota bacterium]MCC7133309.1 GDP-mannose 4,6-dehydratase [Gemmatimonadales bacterium]MDX2057688.1 GDP-mannose 4,6-dehydratase [Gemmatimonadales bacterium]
MKVLVTGADGFVGAWVVRELLRHGHHVVGGIRIGGTPPRELAEGERLRVQWVDFDLLSADSVNALAKLGPDGIIHLAAVASGADARRDPGYAWTVNAAGTARLAEAFGALGAEGRSAPRLLVVSTGEVYGQADRPLLETDPVMPCSPYAASKVGAEIAAWEVSRRTGLPVIVARAFPHTGPGQSDKYVVPALALRLRTAKRIGAPAINTGNLEPIRDFLDVRDVAAAYRLLLERGTPGETYNVASGVGISLGDVVERLVTAIGHRVILEPDPGLSRPNDLKFLVGNSSKLARDTGWAPTVSFDQTLEDLLDAQAD